MYYPYVHWTDISSDPVSAPVGDFLLAELKSRKRVGTEVSYKDFLSEHLHGRTVLDIGMVEHDVGHLAKVGWLHDFVRDASASATGVDILETPIAALAARGYDVIAADATSDTDLGRRWDVVHLGNVIEHVADPVRLLSFAKRHLARSGSIIVNTPNPWFYRHILQLLRTGVFIANAEHVSWVTPSLALELARRSDLSLREYWLLRGKAAPGLRGVVRRALDLVASEADVLALSYTCIFEGMPAE